MIDITDVPEARVGDEVLIFGGEERPITVLAEACDTIPLRDPHDPLDAHPASLLARVSLYFIYKYPSHGSSLK